MSRLRASLLFILLGLGGYWAWNYNPSITGALEHYFESGEFLTLEAKYTPEQLLEANKASLLGGGEGRSFKKPSLQFHPYLLFEVKYSGSGKTTEEGVVLWGLNDGEMVLDTQSWEKSHGFEDCLNAGATRKDFQVINALAASGGALSLDSLGRKLSVESAKLASWIDSVEQKKLVVRNGSELRLHFHKPQLEVQPHTRIAQRLVTKPYKHAKRLKRRYSRSDIERNAKAAFGTNFAIRSHREVFLPVYHIEVKNADGTIASTYWNALNGKQISSLELR